MKVIKGGYNGDGVRVGIVVSRFNEIVGESLLKGAIDTLERNAVKAEDITVVWVPGAMETPLALKTLLSTDIDGAIALGAVIRGATAHFEMVANYATNMTANIGLEAGKPVMNGILTVETIEQAIERSGSKAGNKGSECALGLLEMLHVLKAI